MASVRTPTEADNPTPPPTATPSPTSTAAPERTRDVQATNSDSRDTSESITQSGGTGGDDQAASVPQSDGTSEEDQAPPIPDKGELKYPNLGSRLDQLVASVEAGETTAEQAASGAALHSGESVAVTFYLSGGVEDVVAFLEENGGDPRNVGEDYIEAYVPVTLLGTGLGTAWRPAGAGDRAAGVGTGRVGAAPARTRIEETREGNERRSLERGQRDAGGTTIGSTFERRCPCPERHGSGSRRWQSWPPWQSPWRWPCPAFPPTAAKTRRRPFREAAEPVMTTRPRPFPIRLH